MDQFTVQDDLGHLIKKHDQEAFMSFTRTVFQQITAIRHALPLRLG